MLRAICGVAAGCFRRVSNGIGPAAFGLLALTGISSATTISVNCPGQNITNAIANAFAGIGRPPVNDELIVNVSGTCTEHVRTPPLRLVTIAGPATIQPPSANSPAFTISGGVTLSRLTIKSSLPNQDELIHVNEMDYLRIDRSSVSSSTARALVNVFGNSKLVIYNSTISGGSEQALFVGGTAHVGIYAGEGGTTTIRSLVEDNIQAIGCYGGAMDVHADLGSTIDLGPAGGAVIAARQCHATIGGHGANAGKVRIIGSHDIGIQAKSGDAFSLVQTNVVGNFGRAIEVNAGVMEIDASIIGNNGSGIEAAKGGIIRFNDIYGPSTVGGSDPFSCYQNGRIYADPGQIVGRDDEYDDGCLKVGEFTD